MYIFGDCSQGLNLITVRHRSSLIQNMLLGKPLAGIFVSNRCPSLVCHQTLRPFLIEGALAVWQFQAHTEAEFYNRYCHEFQLFCTGETQPRSRFVFHCSIYSFFPPDLHSLRDILASLPVSTERNMRSGFQLTGSDGPWSGINTLEEFSKQMLFLSMQLC